MASCDPVYVNDLGDSLITFANLALQPFWYFEQNAHYYLLNPLNDPTLTAIKRICIGAIHLVALTLTLPLAILAFLIKGLGNRLHSKEFTYWKGKGEEIPSPVTHKVTHLNTCMFPGGLPYLFGGVRAASKRMQELKELILNIDPDLFFLCEFSATLSSKLYHLFSDQYTHFFVNIGPSACGMDSSMALVSRIPIMHAHFFPSIIAAQREQKFAYRGYFLAQTAEVNYLYVHLHPKETKRAEEIRLSQLKEIRKIIKETANGNPFVVLGDINIDRETKNHIEMISTMGFLDALYEEYGKVETEKGSQSVDGIFLLREESLRAEITLNDTYGEDLPALSDHKGVTVKISWR